MFPGFQRHGHLYFLSSIFSGFIFLPVSEPHFPTSHLLVLSSCVSQLSSECSGTFVFMFSIFLTCLLSCRERIKTNERRLYSPKVFCKTPAVGSGFFFIEKSVFFSVCLSVCLSLLYSPLDALNLPCAASRTLLSDQCIYRDAGAQLFGHIV